MTTILGQAVIQGLMTGAVLALVAAGLALVLGVLRILNFAHGEFLILGMYIVVVLYDRFAIHPYLSSGAVVLALFLIGLLVYRFIIKPVHAAGVLVQAQITLGLIFVMESVMLMLFGADLRSAAGAAFQTSRLHVGVFTLPVPQLIAFATAAVVCVTLYWMLQSTDFGRAVRATAQNPDSAALYGVNVERTRAVVFAMSLALLGIAASVMMPFSYVTPTSGEAFMLNTLIIVVLGGLGDLVGAFFGGLLLGVLYAVGPVLFDTNTGPMIAYLLFILVLLFRPQGLFKRGHG